jgi:hypothetical protein
MRSFKGMTFYEKKFELPNFLPVDTFAKYPAVEWFMFGKMNPIFFNSL